MPHYRRHGPRSRFRRTTSHGRGTYASRTTETARSEYGAGPITRTSGSTKTTTQVISTPTGTSRVKTKEVESPETKLNLEGVRIPGNAGIVMVLAALLFIFSQWQGLSTYFNVWIGKGKNINLANTALNPMVLLGALVFIIVLGMLASTSQDMTALLLLMLFAMWLLYLILGGGAKQFSVVLGAISPTGLNLATGQQNTSTPPAQGGQA